MGAKTIMKRLSAIVILIFLVGISLSIPTKISAQQTKEIILAGYKHKPPVPTSGSGLATVKLKGDTLTVDGSFENLVGRFSGAYIMVSLRGEGGNQIYRLKVELNEEKTGGTINAERNKFPLSKAEKQLLKKGELYINVSSFEHQKGELRGDIPPME